MTLKCMQKMLFYLVSLVKALMVWKKKLDFVNISIYKYQLLVQFVNGLILWLVISLACKTLYFQVNLQEMNISLIFRVVIFIPKSYYLFPVVIRVVSYILLRKARHFVKNVVFIIVNFSPPEKVNPIYFLRCPMS